MTATSLAMSPPFVSSAPSQHSAAIRWFGRIVTGLVVVFMAFDCISKLLNAKQSVEATLQLGYQPHHVPLIGGIALVLMILYVIPRTAFVGAVIWTGYLGGAVASNLRIDNPLLSHTLFPVYFAILLWAGLYARDGRVRALFSPVR